MDRTAPITSPIKSEEEFAQWLLAVLAGERKRLRGSAPRKGRCVVRQTRDASFAANPEECSFGNDGESTPSEKKPRGSLKIEQSRGFASSDDRLSGA